MLLVLEMLYTTMNEMLWTCNAIYSYHKVDKYATFELLWYPEFVFISLCAILLSWNMLSDEHSAIKNPKKYIMTEGQPFAGN